MWCGDPLGDDVHESVPLHAESLEPQFIVPSTKDDPLPLVNVDGLCPDPGLDCVEVFLEHLGIYGI